MAEALSSGTLQTHVLLLPAFYLFLIGDEWADQKQHQKLYRSQYQQCFGQLLTGIVSWQLINIKLWLVYNIV